MNDMIKFLIITQLASVLASMIAVSLFSIMSNRLPVASDILGMIFFGAIISFTIYIFIYYPFVHSFFIAMKRGWLGSVLFLGMLGGIGWAILATCLFVFWRGVDLLAYLQNGLLFAFVMGFIYGAIWGGGDTSIWK